MASLMSENPTKILWRSVAPPFTERTPVDHHAIRSFAREARGGKLIHVAEISAGSIGIDIQIPRRIPRERIPVLPLIVEPGRVL